MRLNELDALFTLQKITLVLGPACNILCRHCLQTKAKKRSWEHELDDGIMKLLSLWSHNVKTDKRLLFKKPMLLFYGGEPLLYYDRLQEIMNKLAWFSFDFDAVELKLFTNGLLLKDDMAQFFNKYGINVVLSYDGPNLYAVRPELASEANIEAWQKIKNKGVATCLTRFNQDYLKTMLFLKKKFRTNDVSIEMVYVNWDMPKDIYAFPKGYLADQLERIITYYTHNRLDKSFLTFTKNYLGKVTGRYRNISIATDGLVLGNRFELNEAGRTTYEYACHSCEKNIVCPFAGKRMPSGKDCEMGNDFYLAYLRYRPRLEALLERDYDYLLTQNY